MTTLRIVLTILVILCFTSAFGTAQVPTPSQISAATGSNFGVAEIAPMSSSESKPSSATSNAQSGTGPIGGLKGCVYNSGGLQYQAVKFKVKRAALVRFDALLYRGATCDRNQFLDEFGFGRKISLGKGTWIFWFVDFPDMLDTSGIWKVGKKRSQCVNYETAPDC